MSREFQVQFVDAKDRGLGLEMIEADSWKDAMLEAADLDVPQGTATIEIAEVTE